MSNITCFEVMISSLGEIQICAVENIKFHPEIIENVKQNKK